jgi:hypothetical protein
MPTICFRSILPYGPGLLSYMGFLVHRDSFVEFKRVRDSCSYSFTQIVFKTAGN